MAFNSRMALLLQLGALGLGPPADLERLLYRREAVPGLDPPPPDPHHARLENERVRTDADLVALDRAEEKRRWRAEKKATIRK